MKGKYKNFYPISKDKKKYLSFGSNYPNKYGNNKINFHFLGKHKNESKQLYKFNLYLNTFEKGNIKLFQRSNSY